MVLTQARFAFHAQPHSYCGSRRVHLTMSDDEFDFGVQTDDEAAVDDGEFAGDARVDLGSSFWS